MSFNVKADLGVEPLLADEAFSTTRTLFRCAAELPLSLASTDRWGGLRRQGFCKRALPGKPLLTVASVVFNAASDLPVTLESVLKIPYDNVELIVIDGGSSDATVDLLRRHDAKIDCWISAPDRGIYDAMNKAWLLAANDASVLFLGGGDRLLSLPKCFDNNRVFFGDVMIGERHFRSSLRLGLRFANHLHHQALIVPKRFHPEPPFDLGFSVYADFDFNQRLVKAGHPFQRDEQLRAYALPGGLSSRFDIGQMAAVTRKNFGPFHACVTLLYFHLKHLMIHGFK